ncbi:hypothetical protein [Actinacidiphila acidipaludis]|uniref:Uncharacterized protein n=1 Tax=Actinacidiphila acidipaludis TaxID=2873382 RepID=A0ABS7Q254_9ACTN|nr:hypothetical protein [Streptomyces acidipaludis]MBY8877053.1 hypothetical protein [Streptomyces acidipaludis]
MRGRQDHERPHGRRTGLPTGADAPSAGTDGMPESTEELLSALSGLVEQTRERITVEQARVDLAVALQRHMLPPELPRLDRLRLVAEGRSGGR